MERLWAPWRMGYVTSDKAPPADECFFCRFVAAAPGDDRANLVALRTPLSLVVLNRFPYNNGHLLIAPKAHKPGLDDLTQEELLDGLEAVRLCVRKLGELMQPHGYNVGLNLGKAAGAGLPGHLHWHVVPRWAGDANFMPAVADVRVIVQSLEELYDLVTPRLASG